MDNTELTQKMREFQSSVAAEVKEQSELVIRNAEQSHGEQYQKAVQEAEEQAETRITERTKSLKRDCLKRTSKQSFDSRRAVLRRRIRLTDEFFSALQNKLIAFADGGEYRSWFEKSIDKAREEMPFDGETVLLVRQKDFDLAARVYPGVMAQVSRKIKVGGVIIRYGTSGIYADLSLDRKMLLQRNDFTHKAELRL